MARTHLWVRRPVLSIALRIAVVATPVLVSFALALLISNALPALTDAWSVLLWIGVLLALGVASLVVFEPAARRLLPLAALLDVSLLFPDHAPPRFKVARRAGGPGDLRERLHEAAAHGDVADARRLQTILELGLALSVHDRATRGHSERVRVFTDLIASEMHVHDHDRALLRWAAILHDIGKLEVPASLLNKDGSPSAAEWAALHRHPEDGARLIAPLVEWLGPWGLAVSQHHERMDGSGYPHGLRGSQISLAARIVAVADAFEVMTGPRTYKRPFGVPAAKRELVRVAGSQLDPVVVRAFLNVSVGRLWRAVGVASWLAQMPLFSRLVDGGVALPSAATAATTAAALAVIGGLSPHTSQAASPPSLTIATLPLQPALDPGPPGIRPALPPAIPAPEPPAAAPGQLPSSAAPASDSPPGGAAPGAHTSSSHTGATPPPTSSSPTDPDHDGDTDHGKGKGDKKHEDKDHDHDD